KRRVHFAACERVWQSNGPRDAGGERSRRASRGERCAREWARGFGRPRARRSHGRCRRNLGKDGPAPELRGASHRSSADAQASNHHPVIRLLTVLVPRVNPLTRRIRVMQQMETSECGLACLAMVLDYHGHSRTLAEMRSVCGSSRDGHSAFELLSAARRLGLDGRGVSTSLAGLAALKRPAILHWSFNHFVVLEDFRRGRAVIVDPASGRRRVSQQELDRSFSGVALELEPTPSLVKRRRRSVSLARYLEPLKQHRATLLFVIVANLI